MRFAVFDCGSRGMCVQACGVCFIASAFGRFGPVGCRNIDWQDIDLATAVEGDHALHFPTHWKMSERCFPGCNGWNDRFDSKNP